MILHAPQIIWLIWVFISLLIYAHEHGKPKTGEYSFPTAFVAILISASLLYWGGFFTAGQ